MEKKDLFTLVELLTVMVILTILASILFPSLVNARAKAKESVRMNNLKQVHGRMIIYANNYNGTLPPIVGQHSVKVGEGQIYTGEIGLYTVTSYGICFQYSSLSCRGIPFR